MSHLGPSEAVEHTLVLAPVKLEHHTAPEAATSVQGTAIAGHSVKIALMVRNQPRESVLSVDSTRRAYQMRDHASDRERFFITTPYERDVSGNLEKEQQTFVSWAQSYPRDRDAHGLMSGFASQGMGQYEESLEEAKIALGIDPDFSPGYINIAFDCLYLDRPSEAEEVVRRAFRRQFEVPEFMLLRFCLAFLKGDRAAMDQAAVQAKGKPGAEDWIAHSEALVLARAGRQDGPLPVASSSALFMAAEALAQACSSGRARKAALKGSAWIGPS